MHLFFTSSTTPVLVWLDLLIETFSGDTRERGLISDYNNKSAYKVEVKCLEAWYVDNNLALNTKKTTELMVDYWMTSLSCVYSGIAALPQITRTQTTDHSPFSQQGGHAGSLRSHTSKFKNSFSITQWPTPGLATPPLPFHIQFNSAGPFLSHTQGPRTASSTYFLQ